MSRPNGDEPDPPRIILEYQARCGARRRRRRPGPIERVFRSPLGEFALWMTGLLIAGFVVGALSRR